MSLSVYRNAICIIPAFKRTKDQFKGRNAIVGLCFSHICVIVWLRGLQGIKMRLVVLMIFSISKYYGSVEVQIQSSSFMPKLESLKPSNFKTKKFNQAIRQAPAQEKSK